MSAAWSFLVRPSNDRDWAPSQSVLAKSVFDGSMLTVTGVRDFRWRSETEFTEAWGERVFDLDRLSTVWFVVVPFPDMKSAAHTFVSFGFEDGRHLGISVEVRKEKGESYSIWKGMMRRFELMYVVADERDLIGLRAIVRKDDVYLYPVKSTPEKKRAMLVDMLERANALAKRPEFYDTLTNSCASNLVRHANRVTPKKVPFSTRITLAGYSDALAYELGMLDVEGTLEEARARWKIDDRAEAIGTDAEDFSARIRE